MSKTGHADLPLHYGRVPSWLANRMTRLGGAIVESILIDYGRHEFMKRMSDPLWFQSFGAVLGMDWHSSGITTSVLGALKKAINPRSGELGLYICGGRGRHSRQTPAELLQVADKTGLDGHALVRNSRLSAKIDNTALQDGFQIYLHNFLVSEEGEWAVVQQGMNNGSGMARRYHWHSHVLDSFLSDPHASVCGTNQGLIFNVVHRDASGTQKGVLQIAGQRPDRMVQEIRKIKIPDHHDVRIKDVDLKRLGAVIALAHETETNDFESFLLLNGLGPRTLQSLVLVSEVIHGTPSRFEDPARFSFAHGGKDGHPFPVPIKVYDETIEFLNRAVVSSKIGHTDKQKSLKKLHLLAKRMETNFMPDEGKYRDWINEEKRKSQSYGGKTVFDRRNAKIRGRSDQLTLF